MNAYILAGGNSSRMGTDKSLLALNGETLIQRALGLLSPLVDETKLVGNHPHLSRFAATVPDRFPGCGPLAAIHAALLDSASKWNLIYAVDQIAPPELLHLLIARTATAPLDCLAIVPEINAHPQPLCALYRKPFAQLAENALIHAQHKIDRLFPSAHALLLRQSDYHAAGITPEILNLNTPEEFSEARRRLEAAKP